MALTNLQLNELLTKNEFKITVSTKSGTFTKDNNRATLIQSLKGNGLALTFKEFVGLCHFLLSDLPVFHVTEKHDYVHLLCSDPSLDIFNASGQYLIALDDTGYYWGLTEVGPAKKTLIEWTAYQYHYLYNSIVSNYAPAYRKSDPRIWMVIDKIGGNLSTRELEYQTVLTSMERLHKEIELAHTIRSKVTPRAPLLVYQHSTDRSSSLFELEQQQKDETDGSGFGGFGRSSSANSSFGRSSSANSPVGRSSSANSLFGSSPFGGFGSGSSFASEQRFTIRDRKDVLSNLSTKKRLRDGDDETGPVEKRQRVEKD